MPEYVEREAVIDLITHRYENPEICTQEINSIPAADVVPVVHGRWIHYPDCGVTRCSHCGWSIEECWEPDFCPNCGAKMDIQDGGDNDAAD